MTTPDSPLSEAAVAQAPPLPKSIAPAWHTIAVLLIMFTLSGFSAITHRLAPGMRDHGSVFGYLTVIVTQWLMVGLVAWGIHLRGLGLRDLIGGHWPRWSSVLRDLGIAVAFLIGSNVILTTVSHIVGADGREVALRLLPRTRAEILVYLLLCATAGFCEEVLFRGYLQKQFTAWTGSAIAGLLLQAIVFGAGHGYQGPKLMVVISVYGCLFGWLALQLRSLRPGMMTHFLQDSLAILLSRVH